MSGGRVLFEEVKFCHRLCGTNGNFSHDISRTLGVNYATIQSSNPIPKWFNCSLLVVLLSLYIILHSPPHLRTSFSSVSLNASDSLTSSPIMHFRSILPLSLLPLSLLPLTTLALRPRDERVLNTTVLILGGGMTGVSAAHSLAIDRNITDFLVLEARHELGGRVQQGKIGDLNIELGANWVEGLGTNPIWTLAQKYGINNRYSNWSNIDYFTEDGWQDETGSLAQALTRYEEEVFIKASADAGRRKALGLPDLSMKAGLRVAGWNPLTPEERAAEYFSHDWEQAEPPVESSFIGTIEVYNETFIEFGNSDNHLVIDQGGYKQVIIKYGDEIPNFQDKVLFGEVVETIEYRSDGVTVKTASGLTVNAEYALCTFS